MSHDMLQGAIIKVSIIISSMNPEKIEDTDTLKTQRLNPEEITQRIFDDLQSTLAHARDCYEIWWAFVGERPDRDDFLNTARAYESFFHSISISCFCTFLMKFTTIFDESKDSVSLRAYYNRVRQLPRNSRGRDFSEIEAEMEALWPEGRSLYKVRNKIVAHRSMQNFRRHFLSETGYTVNEVRKFLNQGIQIVSDLCVHHLDYDGGFDDLSGDCLNDLESLIARLQTEDSRRNC